MRYGPIVQNCVVCKISPVTSGIFPIPQVESTKTLYPLRGVHKLGQHSSRKSEF